MADITVDKKYFEDIYKKALLYDKMIEDRRKGANIVNNIPKEERKKRAQAAAAARWKNKK
ncbi:MAG: hypothetical protein K6G49_02050 [Candidatus Saccharibacteria bacterium]|nr:hypothetical protein [Candidatus Saccharibacteria bacterium]